MNEIVRFENSDGDIVELEVSPDLIRDLGVSLKERLTALYREIAEVAFLARQVGDTGGLASVLVTRKDEIETWADVYEQWPSAEAVDVLAPINPKWWRAVLDTDDPSRWLVEALQQELGSTQIRKRAGVVKSRSNGKVRVRGKLREWRAGTVRLHVSLDVEPPENVPDDGIPVVLEVKL